MMSSPLGTVGEVPSLDVLASSPEAAANLPPPVVLELLGRSMHCIAVLFARIVVASAERRGGEPEPGNEEWISADEVTRRFGLSARWLIAHRRLLFGRRIISRPSRKTTVYHARRMARLLEERSLPPGA